MVLSIFSCVYGPLISSLETFLFKSFDPFLIGLLFVLFFKRFYLFIFRERGREGERKRNISV